MPNRYDGLTDFEDPCLYGTFASWCCVITEKDNNGLVFRLDIGLLVCQHIKCDGCIEKERPLQCLVRDTLAKRVLCCLFGFLSFVRIILITIELGVSVIETLV